MKNTNSDLNPQDEISTLAHVTPDEAIDHGPESELHESDMGVEDPDPEPDAHLDAAHEERTDDGHMYPDDVPFDEYLHGGE